MVYSKSRANGLANDHFLRVALPDTGFVYPETKLILSPRITAKVLRAFKTLCTEEVDNLLAQLFHKAQELRPYYPEAVYDLGLLYMQAGQATAWSCRLSGRTVVALMQTVRRARSIYIKFSRYRRAKDLKHDKSKLAKAIDAFTGISPSTEPSDLYSNWSPRLLRWMMHKIQNREPSDWSGGEDDVGEENVSNYSERNRKT